MLRDEQLEGSSPLVTTAEVSLFSQSIFVPMLREELLEMSCLIVTASQVSFSS
jgi:hypothetical protein